jgi:hypothetical protein
VPGLAHRAANQECASQEGSGVAAVGREAAGRLGRAACDVDDAGGAQQRAELALRAHNESRMRAAASRLEEAHFEGPRAAEGARHRCVRRANDYRILRGDLERAPAGSDQVQRASCPGQTGQLGARAAGPRRSQVR